MAQSPEALVRRLIEEGFNEGNLDVADPWYGGAEDFEACLAQIEAAADRIVEHVRNDLGNVRARQNS